MEQYIRDFSAWRCFTYMGAFGGASPKGTVLWSNRPGVKKLSRNLSADAIFTAEMVTKSVGADGKKSVTGAKDLKASQAYTPEFGLAAVDMWRVEQAPPCMDFAKAVVPNIWAHQSKKDRWEDAKLVSVMQYLTMGITFGGAPPKDA